MVSRGVVVSQPTITIPVVTYGPPDSATRGAVRTDQEQSFNPWLTVQHCYQLADGYEVCVYEGPVCWDTHDWSARAAAQTGRRYASAGLRDNAVDPRRLTPRLHRVMGSRTAAMPNLPPEAYADTAAWAATPAGRRASPLDPTREGRTWGPEGGIQMAEISWEAIAAATTPGDLTRLGATWGDWAARARPAAALEAHHAALAAEVTTYDAGRLRVTSVASAPTPPERVAWLIPRATGSAAAAATSNGSAIGSAWLGYFGQEEFAHPYHFAAAAMLLWSASRINSSGPVAVPRSDGDEPCAATRRVRVVGNTAGVPLPSIDALMLIGPYVSQLEHAGQSQWSAPLLAGSASVPPWARGALPLLVQPHTKVLLYGDMSRETGGSGGTLAGGDAQLPAPGDAQHWICVPRAVTGSVNLRVFSTPADAAAFRAAAWKKANVSALRDEKTAPAVAVVRRFPRRLFNTTALHECVTREVAAVGATWSYLGDETPLQHKRTIGFSFEDQVRQFASVDVLVSPHGGALMNTVFMRPGSTVIEVFSAYYRPPMYADMAALLGLHYIPLLTQRPRLPVAAVATIDAREASLSMWSAIEGDDVSLRCEGRNSTTNGAGHPAHADTIALTGPKSICAHAGKFAAADVDYGVLSAALRQALRAHQSQVTESD